MPPRAPFPDERDKFDRDYRISYSKQDARFVLEDENGEEWEWIEGPRKWTKTMDEAAIQRQQEIYKMQGVNEDAPAMNPAKKRKEAQLEDAETNSKGAKITAGTIAKTAATANATSAAKTPRPNTAVFVTGLPQDVDHEEIRDYFSKFGMIAESIDGDEKRVKLYNDKDGNFKGEALIIYHRPESVQLAIEMSDQAPFPRREYDTPTSVISVAEADSTFKAHKDDTVAEERPKGKAKVSRAKAKQKAEEMNSRLGDWSDDEPSTMHQTSSRWDKVVVIKNAFHPEDLEMDPDFYQDAIEDMREGAEPHGEVKNVTLFDKEEEGIITIRFSNAMAATACADALNGRSYAGRKLKTAIADGSEKFKKSRKPKIDQDEEAKRLEDYSNFIEGKGDSQ